MLSLEFSNATADEIASLLDALETKSIEEVKEAVMSQLRDKLRTELQNVSYDSIDIVDELVQYVKEINPKVCPNQFEMALLYKLVTAFGQDGFYGNKNFPKPTHQQLEGNVNAKS